MSTPDDFGRITARADGLLALAWRAWPTTVHFEEGKDSLDNWDLYAPALLVRCTYLFESARALVEREADAEILSRSLYDHVLTFAWVAANPQERMQRIVAEEFRQRILIDDEAQKLGYKAFPPETRAEFVALRDKVKSSTGFPPNVQVMAKEADEAWSAEMPGILDKFSAAYTVYFRGHSTAVHPTGSALRKFFSPVARGQARLGRPMPPGEGRGWPLQSASGTFTTLLLIASHLFRRPSARDVLPVWLRYPADPKTVPPTVPG